MSHSVWNMTFFILIIIFSIFFLSYLKAKLYFSCVLWFMSFVTFTFCILLVMKIIICWVCSVHFLILCFCFVFFKQNSAPTLLKHFMLVFVQLQLCLTVSLLSIVTSLMAVSIYAVDVTRNPVIPCVMTHRYNGDTHDTSSCEDQHFTMVGVTVEHCLTRGVSNMRPAVQTRSVSGVDPICLMNS